MNSLNPLVVLFLFLANLLALALTLSVLILALWQQPGNRMGRAVTQFLAALALYNLGVMLEMAALALNSSPDVITITTNLSVTGFALATISEFALVVSMAGVMRQAYQVLARAGVI